MALKLDAGALTQLMHEVFPQVKDDFEIVSVTETECVLRMKVSERHLRPGGTVSGPAMFTLADCAFYFATLSRIGAETLTVTTNLSIDFMRKPPPRDLIGTARILKLGRTLSVGDVLITAAGDDTVLARASVTYAIPPR